MSRGFSTRAFALAAVALLVGGCGDSGPLTPPEVRLGEDVCAVCGMSVSDGRYAAAVVYRSRGRDGVLLVDDVGELPRVAAPAHDRVAVFVRDESTQEWLKAGSAYYVRSDNIRTPMGTGVAAFAVESVAEARRAETGGEMTTFEALCPQGIQGNSR